MLYDAIVIGGGPAGLNAALVLGRARRRTLLIDSGEPRNAPAAAMHGFLSRDGLPPQDLRRIAREELSRYDSVELRDGIVKDASGQVDDFTIRIVGGREEETRRVVLATGVIDELPPIDGLRELWGKSVLHCPYCHGWEVRGEPIAVLGASEDAARFALHLKAWSDDVILCTNGRSAFDDATQELLKSRGVETRHERVVRLDASGEELKEVVFDVGSVPRRALFVKPKTRQCSDLAAQLGCKLLDDGAVEVNDFGSTSVQGVYAVGDMSRRPAFPFPAAQVVMAAASGATAAVVIDQELLFVDLYS